MLIQRDNFGYEESFRCRYHENIYNYPTHIHQFAEIAIVTDGEIEITSSGKCELATACDVAIIPPFTPHSFRTLHHANVWIAVFSPSFFDVMLSDINNRSKNVFKASAELFSYIKARLVSEERNIYSIKSSILAIGEEFIRKTEKEKDCPPASVLPKLFLYLEENFKEDLSLKSVSSAIGYSESYISHALADIPEMNFSSLLSGIRIEAAKKLLIQRDVPISGIALECGFGTERSFHRAFAKLVGMTPLEYRKRRRSVNSDTL